jgi:hypothetical protein
LCVSQQGGGSFFLQKNGGGWGLGRKTCFLSFFPSILFNALCVFGRFSAWAWGAQKISK